MAEGVTDVGRTHYWRRETGALRACDSKHLSALWTCAACKDNVWREPKNFSRHELSDQHKRTLESLKRRSELSFTPPIPCKFAIATSLGTNTGLVRPFGILGSHQVNLDSDEILAHDYDLSFEEMSSIAPSELSEMVNKNGSSINGRYESEESISWPTKAFQTTLESHSDRRSFFNNKVEDHTEDEVESDFFCSIDKKKLKCTPGVRQSCSQDSRNTTWRPWLDKVFCVFDILKNLPRGPLFLNETKNISWALRAFGIPNFPADLTKVIDEGLQMGCGIRSIRYISASRQVYYVNDLAGIIAQEMANPKVRPYLEVLPENARGYICNANQGARWLHELDSELTTPMIRQNGQDYYIFEPVILLDGTCCIPNRWFKSDGLIRAKAWRITAAFINGILGWTVDERSEMDIDAGCLSASFPFFCRSFIRRGLADPRINHGSILGTDEHLRKWTRTNPTFGNKWRERASGHQVYAFPIWLYCGNASLNPTSKVNKHNSFLFAPAGLANEHSHRAYNVHFLATSSVVTAIEMLDGIVDQLERAQVKGIWAWDCKISEVVLVIPSVLGLLGDNPMQYRLSGHTGLGGTPFCRECKIKESTALDDENTNEAPTPIWRIKELNAHRDTPIEVRRIVVQGVLKYFWRDAVSLLSKEQKDILTTRLYLINIKGLFRSPLAGKYLVKYAGCLTGHDLQTISQVAPFVFYDLLPQECYDAWVALSLLVPLVWLQKIMDIDIHAAKLNHAIECFLRLTAQWTPRWFSNPNFHIILHLAEHIRRFGPAVLFSTETFESYNNFIRAFGINSSRHMLSLNIAKRFANANRIRHLTSGARFRFNKTCSNTDTDQAVFTKDNHLVPNADMYSSLGSDAYNLLQEFPLTDKDFGLEEAEESPDTGYSEVEKLSNCIWMKTASSKVISQQSADLIQARKHNFVKLLSCNTQNGDNCSIKDWVIAYHIDNSFTFIGRVYEMLQVVNSNSTSQDKPDYFLLSIYSLSSSSTYKMPRLLPTFSFTLLPFENVLCVANVQHDCSTHKCEVVNMTRRFVRPAGQERTVESSPAMLHRNPDDMILNCGKIRDYEYTQLFCTPLRAVHPGRSFLHDENEGGN